MINKEMFFFKEIFHSFTVFFYEEVFEINILSLLIAFLPLLVLLVSMLGMKWSAPKAGTVAWIVAGFCAWVFFGADGFLLIAACAKGLSLSLFVLLIIWSAVFLYNFLKSLSAIEVIGMSMIKLVRPRLGQILLLSWVFSGIIRIKQIYQVSHNLV